MPLRAHLLELRKRLVLASIGVVLGAVLAWIFYDPVFEAIQQPLEAAGSTRDGLVSLNFAGVAAPFDMRVKITVFLGVILSSPWWLYQLWAFITPGLTRRERGYAFGFLGAAVPLFLGGALLAWYVLPHAVQLLIEFTPSGATNLVDAQTYLGFVMRVMLVFGLAFLLPVVMVALNFAGLGTAATWRKGWRWAVMIAFTFSAIMTPTPDAITMIAVAIPICLLYAGALVICTVHDRRVDRRRLAAGLPKLDGTFPDDAEAPAT
jgi:sec-independent protein translocase protein TatC